MKKNIILVIALSIAVCVFQSCSEDTIGDLGTDDSFLVAVINQDEEVFNITGGLDAYITDSNLTFDVCGIINRYTQKSIVIRMPLDVALGTHNFDDKLFAFVKDGSKTWSTQVGEGEGSVTIESIDDVRYTGSFSFTAYDYDYDNIRRVLSVTNGKFDVLKR